MSMQFSGFVLHFSSKRFHSVTQANEIQQKQTGPMFKFPKGERKSNKAKTETEMGVLTRNNCIASND